VSFVGQQHEDVPLSVAQGRKTHVLGLGVVTARRVRAGLAYQWTPRHMFVKGMQLLEKQAQYKSMLACGKAKRAMRLLPILGDGLSVP
jgi:hypothetical protein